MLPLKWIWEIVKENSINCLAALSKCRHLRKLDLSLTSQSISLTQLLRSTSKLIHLEWLSIKCNDGAAAVEINNFSWPPALRTLQVSGTLTDAALNKFQCPPKSLNALTFFYCPRLSTGPVRIIAAKFADSLEALHLGRQANNIRCGPLIDWLRCLPKLRRLHTTLDWQGSLSRIVTSLNDRLEGQSPYPLEHLELDCKDVHGYWIDDEYEDLYAAISEGYLGRLRRLEFWHRLTARPPKRCRNQVQELDDLLRALAREDGENANIKERIAGAYICRG